MTAVPAFCVPVPMFRTLIATRTCAVLQVGPELEVPGYGCEDHFLEQDTIEHSWECIAVR